MKKHNSKTHFVAKLLERLEKGPRAGAGLFVCRLHDKKDLNVNISSRTVNCQLYQIKKSKNDFAVAGLKQIRQRSSRSAL